MSGTPFKTLGEAFGAPDNRPDNVPTVQPSYQAPPKRATTKRNKIETFISKTGWAVVVLTALSLSWYSLYWVGIRYGVPPVLAVLISTAFDGACIVMGDLNLKYARSSDSGLMPRLGMTVLATISAYLNAQHAIIAHDPVAARIFFSAPPITAVLVWEMHTRYEKRSALRRNGRVAKSLPTFDKRAWLLCPIRTPRLVRHVIRARLIQAMSGEPMETVDEPARKIRFWAKTQGIQISDRGRIAGPVLEAYQAELEATNNGNGNGHTS